MGNILKFLAFILLSFWCCFYYNGEFVCGSPDHFEEWYAEDGTVQQIIWMDGECYTVDADDLTMIYYEDKIYVG